MSRLYVSSKAVQGLFTPITMSWFKKKDTTTIPPVNEQARNELLSTGVPNRVGSTSPRPGGRVPPASTSIGDPYSRGRANLEEDRAQLFAGYHPEKHQPTDRFTDGPSQGGSVDGQVEEEDEAEGIKKQSRFTKQESVNSTRNALRLAREAEETARNTLGRLGDQSGT